MNWTVNGEESQIYVFDPGKWIPTADLYAERASRQRFRYRSEGFAIGYGLATVVAVAVMWWMR